MPRAANKPAPAKATNSPQETPRRAPRNWLWGAAAAVLAVALLVVLVRPFDGAKSATRPPPGPAPDGMVWVPGGTFRMGDNDFPDARPVHAVTLDGFWLDTTEVTKAQFARFVTERGSVSSAEVPPEP